MTSRGIPSILRGAGLSLLTLLVGALALAGQSAQEVVGEAMRQWDANLAGVSGVTLVQRTTTPTGHTTVDTVRLVKRVYEGHAYLVPTGTADTEIRDAARVHGFYPGLGEPARYQGVATVEGHRCHELVVDDREALDRWLQEQMEEVGAGVEGQPEITLQEARAYLDTDTYALRRQQMKGTLTREGRSTPVQREITSSDYREVNGLLYHFRRVTKTTGLTGTMSPEELREARENVREMENRLEEMSPQERRMAEAYMGDRIEKWRNIVESGTLTTTVEVLELEVDRRH